MRSDVIKKGVPAAPNRSLLYALGYTKEEIEHVLSGHTTVLAGPSGVGKSSLINLLHGAEQPVAPGHLQIHLPYF